MDVSTKDWNVDIEMTEEQSDVLSQLEELELEPEKKKNEGYEEVEKKAIEQIAQFALFGVQSSARWYLKNPSILISKETQAAFIETLPAVLDECEIQAPDFLLKYQARFAMGFIFIGMIGDIANQQRTFKEMKVIESVNEEGK